MPLRFGSRRREFKAASADGNFDDNIGFDAQIVRARSDETWQPMHVTTFKTNSNRTSESSPTYSNSGSFHKEERGLNLTSNTLEVTSVDDASPMKKYEKKATTSSEPIGENLSTKGKGKKGRFKFMKFSRKKGKHNSRKSKKGKVSNGLNPDMSLDEIIDRTGMQYLNDSYDNDLLNEMSVYESETGTSFAGDHTSTWEADEVEDYDYGDEGEVHRDEGNYSAPLSSDFNEDIHKESSQEQDGFFAPTFNWSKAGDFSEEADDAAFQSFAMNDDWDPTSCDFASFDESNGFGEVLVGGSNTLVSNEMFHDVNSGLPKTPDESMHSIVDIMKTPEQQGPQKQIVPERPTKQLSGPIDLDTLEPYNSPRKSKSHFYDETESTKINLYENSSFDEEKGSSSYDETHNFSPNRASAFSSYRDQKKKHESAQLTLGVLAQISGLADFDAGTTDDYGQSYHEKDDSFNDHDEEIANATKQLLEDHEKSSPEEVDEDESDFSFKHIEETITPVDFKEQSLFAADQSEIIRDVETPKSPTPPSPFHANISGIPDDSQDQVYINEISDDNVDPRALASAFEDAGMEYEMNTIEAETEMNNLLSNVKGTYELPADFDFDEKTEDHENSGDDLPVSDIKSFWHKKEKKLLSIQTELHEMKPAVNVDWPDAPVNVHLREKGSKEIKSHHNWDVPTSVIADPAASIAEMSSICEQSFDPTDDGQPTRRKSAKEAYRATKTTSSGNSSKGFFWRSHPEKANVMNKIDIQRSQSRRRAAKVEPKDNFSTPKNIKIKKKEDAPKSNKDLASEKSIRSSASQKSAKSSTSQKSQIEDVSELLVRIASSRGKEKTASITTSNRGNTSSTFSTTNTSVPWDKKNLKLRSVQTNEKAPNTKSASEIKDSVGSSPTAELRKSIEAKIKFTSDKVRAARNEAFSSSNAVPVKPSVIASKFSTMKRQPSPFQANRHSFVTKIQEEPSIKGKNPTSDIKSESITQTNEQSLVEDDKISACSTSISDRIKQFETSKQSDAGKSSAFSRGKTPLNSYALNKLRTVTGNVGGLWS